MEGLLTAMRHLLTETSQPNSIPSVLSSLQRLLAALPPYLPALMATIETLAQQVQQDVTSTSQSAKGSSQSRHLSGLTSLHIFRPSQGQPGLANLIITIE